MKNLIKAECFKLPKFQVFRVLLERVWKLLFARCVSRFVGMNFQTCSSLPIWLDCEKLEGNNGGIRENEG